MATRISLETEDIIKNTITAESAKTNQFVTGATPQTAQRVGEIHNAYPGLPAGVKLSLAKAGFTNEQIDKIYPAASTAVIQQSVKPKEKKSWFERNVMDKAKTASRYTFAGLNLPLDFVQGGLAQITDTNDNIDGWFISTDLGSLIANDTQAGSGWFMGDKARELQAERARRYRGTVGGHAWTIGRGLASTVLKPDTMAFNLMSGALDAATAVYIPTVPGAKQARAAILAAEEVGKGGKIVSEAANVLEAVGRGSTKINATKATKAEIDDWRNQIMVGNQVDFEAANKWFGTKQAQRVIERTANTTDFAGVRDLWGGKIDVDLAHALAKEGNSDNIRIMLADKLGQAKGLTDVKDFRGGNKVYMSLGRRDRFIESMPLGQGVSRAYAKMPKKTINLFQAETSADKINNIDTIDNMLRLVKTDPALRRDMLNRAADLLVSKDPNAISGFTNDLDRVIRSSVEQQGVHKDIVDAIFNGYNKLRDDMSRFNIDENYDVADAGLYHNMFGGTNPNAVDDSFAGPQLVSELGKHEYFIPDVRQIRRLTGSKVNWLYTKSGKLGDPNLDRLREAGQLRLPFAAANAFQQEVWRPIITATLGNFVRNVVDSQVMISVSDKPVSSLLHHPMQYLTTMRGDQKFADIFGRAFDEAVSSETFNDAQQAYRYALNEAMNAQYKDPVEVWRKAKRLGTWVVRDRTIDEPAVVARGHADEIGKLNADWAARQIAGGKSTQQVLGMVRSGDEDAVKWFETMKRYYKDGRQTYNRTLPKDQAWSRQSLDLTNDTNLVAVLDETQERVVRMTANHPELQRAVAEGKLSSIDINAGDIVGGEPQVGSRVIYKTGKRSKAEGEVVAVNQATGQVEVRPFAFRGGEGTKEMHDLLRTDAIYNDPGMPKRVGMEVIDPQTKTSAQMKASMDRIIDMWHGHLYNQPIGKLERSPVFKELYHEWIDKLAVSLDSNSVDEIINDITTRATAAGVKPERYMKEATWNKLLDIQSGKLKNYGTITREELNSFASGAAIDEMQKMFYNAVERSNGIDAFRFLAPFAQQQAEFLGRLGRTAFTPVAGGKVYLPDVNVLRKTQLGIHGATQADPDGNGRGFVYKDPTSGQWSFTFPMSGQLSKLLTGVTAPINAPLKGIALGLDYRPGLGPMATLAVSKIMPDSPNMDMARNFLLPFGEKRGLSESFLPSWYRKIYDGFTGSEGSTVFMNTYVETMEALAATGEYDTADPNAREKLMHDAKRKAQVLTMLRGFTQFTGPAAGNLDQLAKTGEVDAYASQLAKAFQELKNNDYDTSVANFIEIFGKDAFAYMGSKTKSLYGGLEASKEFGVFERSNKSLFNQYKDVAGYFGPVGTDFDFNVYSRQLASGKRVKLKPEETLAMAEQTIGSAYYRTMRKDFPANPSEEQQAYLRQYKQALQKAYPGYAQMVYDPNKVPRAIEQLKQAASLSSLDGNQTAEGVRYYMTVRDAAIAEANNRGLTGLTGNAVADLREYLANYAAAITEKYPEFARVYDRLLSQEVEQ